MPMPCAGHGHTNLRARPALRRDQRGATALEFAILAVPFFMMVLGVMEVGFDLFLQEATDLALQAGARQMEVGASQGSASESSFVTNYVCNSTAGRLLICGKFHIKVHLLTASETSNGAFAAVSTGTLPMNGHEVNLAGYDATGAFCNAPPGALIMISAIYLGPTFLSGLLPFVFNETYMGTPVHAVLSQVGVASENFLQNNGTAPTCS